MRLSEFTILELLRLHRVTIDDLDLIKILFKQIDTCEGGNIDKLMLAKAKLMRGYGSISESSHHNVVDFSKFSPNLQTPPYSPMVQLEPDFLQIMNQRDMENQLSPTSEQQISPSWKEWNEGSFPSPVGLRRMTYDQYHETIVRPIIDYQEYQITSSRGNSEFSMTFASPIRDFLLTMTNESPRDSNDD